MFDQVLAHILSYQGMHNNPYRQTRYLSSAHNLSQMPADSGAELALIGRSNVGKSSVINTLGDNKSLARISKTPGRTQLINFFSVTHDVRHDVRLVDLPGYGFARVPQAMQARWRKMVSGYLETRRSLRGLLLITDIRRLLNDADRQMLAWCVAAQLPVRVLLNKSDKLSSAAAHQALLKMQQTLAASGPQVQLFSALKKQGLEELCAALDAWLFSIENIGEKTGKTQEMKKWPRPLNSRGR